VSKEGLYPFSALEIVSKTSYIAGRKPQRAGCDDPSPDSPARILVAGAYRTAQGGE